MKIMSKWYLLSLLAILVFTNCSKEDQAEIDRAIIQQYIEDNNLDGMIEDPSGLFYKIRVEGTGDHPTLSNKVKVAYKGYLTNGLVFDETEPGSPINFPLTNLISGWQIGIQKMKKGGESTMIIPSQLAYGSNPPPGIPANAVLVFEIRLVDFT